MDKFFAVFGKVALVIIVAGALLAGGAYFGKKYMGSPQVASTPSSAEKNAITSIPVAQETLIPSPIQSKNVRVSVSGGGVYTFSSYTLAAFTDWTVTKNHDSAGSDKVVISKDDYQLVILQGPMDGGGCFFPGESQTGMGTTLTDPVATIPLMNGTTLKRGQADSQTNPGKETDDVCGQGRLGNSQYGTFTDFGVITYVTPINRDPNIIAQMDTMVGSLKKN